MNSELVAICLGLGAFLIVRDLTTLELLSRGAEQGTERFSGTVLSERLDCLLRLEVVRLPLDLEGLERLPSSFICQYDM